MRKDTPTNVPVLEKFLPLFEYSGDTVVFEGSSGSGKTTAITQALITWMLAEPLDVFAVRFDGTTCRDTIVEDFRKIMSEQFGVWGSAGRWNDKKMSYRFNNGSKMEFGGTQNPAKLHGHKQDILWVNEAMEVHYEAWKQMNQRTKLMSILDFNPSLTHHWVFSKIMTQPRDSYLYIHSTFRDNPFLAAKARKEIEAYEPTPENIQNGTADKWQWEVYGLGIRGRREGTIFTLWSTCDKFPDPSVCERHGYGLDLGYSEDPKALIECALWNDALYLREAVYETKLLTTPNVTRPNLRNLSDLMQEYHVSPDAKIIAESANPESLDDLRACGWNVVPVKKTAGSIEGGLDRMKRYKIFVDIASPNLQVEFENYVYDKKSGKPIDKYNHGIDAARYWALDNLRPRRGDRGMAARRAKRGQGRRVIKWPTHTRTENDSLPPWLSPASTPL